jgi:hypothetical protein
MGEMELMRESNRNLDTPRAFGFWRFGQVKFPTYICNSRSNTPRIGKTFHNFVILELQSFSFHQKLSSILQSRFLSVNSKDKVNFFALELIH